MRIIYFHRNHKSGYSIAKVSETYIAELRKMPNVKVIEYELPYIGGSPIVLIKNMIYAYKHANKNDVIHVTGDVYYLGLILPAKKLIITLHDIGLIEKHINIKNIYIYLFWFFLPMLRVKWIVCISDETKKKYRRFFPLIPFKKLLTIHNAYSPEFKYSPKVFNAEYPTILLMGTYKNKNIDRTIQALSGIRCHIRIIGQLSKDIESNLKQNKIDYSNGVNLNDEEIVKEYINSDIVCFASWYEGFGMPIIEAQATGRVVVTSNISPMNNVAGRGAVLVDPYDIDSIRQGVLSVIKDDDYRTLLMSEGLANVARFTSRNIAKEYYDLYQLFNK